MPTRSEPDYGQDRRIAWANLRGGGRPSLFSHAHGGRRFRLVRPSARIQLRVGDRARIVDSLLDLLRARGELYDFGEGASLARVTDDARPLPVGRDWLTDHLDRTAEFYVLKATNPDQPPDEVICDAPAWASLRIIAKDGERGIPKLDAVISAPTLRADGSILAEAGYDAASRLLFVADSPDLPHIPEAPTPAQVRAALETLWAPVALFPYVDAVDRGCILAALLTAAVRGSIPTAPGFALDAPTAGMGKTLLAQAIGALCVGYLPPVVPPVNNQDEETRKLLFAALRDGHRVLIWDNVRDPLGNAALDAFLTSPTFAGRVLQTSSTAVLPNRALFLATGNNLTLLSDTCRRLFPVRLDARIEQPYAREFAFDPAQVVLSRRLELVAAALTIIRGWIAAGRVRHGKGRTASFETWDELVRQPVCWIATWDQRFADPLKATERAFSLDPETTKLSALLSAWAQTVGTQPTTTGELITHAVNAEALRDALEEIAGTPRGDLNRRILGKWIAGRVDRRHNGMRITRGTLRSGSPTWVLAVESGPLVGLVGSGGFAAGHSAPLAADPAEAFR